MSPDRLGVSVQDHRGLWACLWVGQASGQWSLLGPDVTTGMSNSLLDSL